MLASAKLRLHKIVSNSQEVMNAFNPEDRADSKQDLDLGTDAPSTQRSLGVHWDMKADTFTFRIAGHDELFTKRKVLSEINSIYDPIGFASPVVIAGKMLLRDMTQEKTDWDEPLPKQLLSQWREWRASLGALSHVQIPRAYTPFPSTSSVRRELHTFSDASNKAIAAVSYLKTTGEDGHIHVRFMIGKVKAATTIPRLELCGAVLAAEIVELVQAELDLPIDEVYFFTDSKVVLGYICNTTRRFHMYVCNRVNRIHRSTDPKQWRYVPTHLNPADLATRSIKAEDLQKSTWIVGPETLRKTTFPPSDLSSVDSTCELADDPEVRPMVTCSKVVTKSQSLGTARFGRFSSWTSVVRAVTNLHVIRCTKPTTENAGCRSWHVCERNKSLEETRRAEGVIIRCIQREAFGDDIKKLEEGKVVEKSSNVIKLNPMLNQDGIMCVGGRLRRSTLPTAIKHPVLIPGKSHVGTLLVRHFHNKIHHQRRHFTEAAIR
ncbi:uncharacterized protein [Antedon mediterranea]|uniref:uncharacterized protein n=1 Tax=Antedon mediterranea TaxID=105859 RepID=UPI003AF65648